MRALFLRFGVVFSVFAGLGAGCGGGNPTDGSPDARAALPDLLMPDLAPYPACQGPTPMGAAFNDGMGGITPRDLAADFTVPTLDGNWSLKQSWTGCDSYLFVVNGSAAYQDQLWTSSTDDLLALSPTNVHYVFLTMSTDAQVMADMVAMKANIDASVAALDAPTQAMWKGRFHYVTRTVRGLGNWLTDYIEGSKAPAFGIDRSQHLREAGYLAPVTGQSSPAEISLIANEARYYNFEWTRDQQLAGEATPTILHVFDGTQMSNTADVAFPDAATMQTFDTMELDMGMWCAGHTDASCAQWDYIQDLVLCDAADNTMCNTIIGRFITTYHREGRWIVDVSPLLPLLAQGGTRRLQYSSQYLNQLDIRLSNSGKGGHPAGVVPLWNGQWNFDQTYNMNFMPQMVPIPANASRVQLFAFISGHGFGMDEANCAEFCDHEHRFTVGGTEYVRDFPDAGSATGCQDEVAMGTVPNQYGTWPLGRGGWCPGKDVTPYVVDVTKDVMPGTTAMVSYRGTFMGQDYVPVPDNAMDGGFGALIRLQSWLVYWTD